MSTFSSSPGSKSVIVREAGRIQTFDDDFENPKYKNKYKMIGNAVPPKFATIAETVFENRFMHVQELIRMGADIEINQIKILKYATL